MPKHYMFLMIAILTEAAGTAALEASQQFTKVVPSVIVVLGYGISFYFLALTLKFMPVGIVYAIWSGVGIVAIAAIGYVMFGQKLDLPAVFGMGLIIVGILIIHLYSKTATH